jgi:hypothetical protein
MISLSAIADLLAPSYLITSSAGADHESRRSAVGASGTSDRKDSTPRWQETAALQDFNPAYDRFGSKAAEMIGAMQRPMSALPPKADKWQIVSACPLSAKNGQMDRSKQHRRMPCRP